MRKALLAIFLLFSFNLYGAGAKIDIPKYDWSWKDVRTDGLKNRKMDGRTDGRKTDGKKIGRTEHYNKFMAGNLIAMTSPLSDGLVDYDDGTESTMDQMTTDVTTFLAWAAEPSLEDRKRMGLKVILFLLVLFVLAYISKQQIWRDIKH